MSQSLTTQGVVLKRGNGAATEVFTSVAEVLSFDGPGGSAAVIDVTHLLSTAKEKRVGLMDEGKFMFKVNMIPSDTSQAGLRSDRANRTLRNFQLLLTDAGPTTASFAAFVLMYKLTGAKDGVIQADIELEVSGAVTYA